MEIITFLLIGIPLLTGLFLLALIKLEGNHETWV
jgi:hypothetical protein